MNDRTLPTISGTTVQGFGSTSMVAGVESASTAVAAQAKALVEARYIMAMRRPRDMDAVRERMVKECRRPSFAAVARYIKPIGKDKAKWPTGPSIRFAEAAVRSMTNITVETMTVYDDRQQRIVRVMVTDLEANVPYSQDVTITKTIERRAKKDGDTVISTRTNSYGDLLYILEATDDDIQNKQNALISKAVRTLGLRLIPGDIVDECMEIVVQTQANKDAQDPDAAKRTLFDSFATIGVSVDQIKEYLGHGAATLTPAELADLRALFSAIRDGEATWRDAMDGRTAQQGDGWKDAEKAPWDAEKFAAMLKKQRGTVESGTNTAEALVKWMEAKHPLTDEQRAAVLAIKPASAAATTNPTGEMSAAEIEAAKARELAEEQQ